MRDKVYYIGGLYEKLNNKKCEILSRSESKNDIWGNTNWYRVKFNDGKEIETIEITLSKEKRENAI